MFLKLLPPLPTPTPPSSQFQVVGGNAAHLQLALSYRMLGVARPGWYPASWSSLSLATAWACDEWAIPNSFPNLKNTQPNRTEPESRSSSADAVGHTQATPSGHVRASDAKLCTRQTFLMSSRFSSAFLWSTIIGPEGAIGRNVFSLSSLTVVACNYRLLMDWWYDMFMNYGQSPWWLEGINNSWKDGNKTLL